MPTAVSIEEFLLEFKRETEARWRDSAINPTVYGFQLQRGTRWLPGLTDHDIKAYEAALNARFPDDFRHMLRVMNGTDLPALNVYGSNGEPHRTRVGVYSYPRDLPVVLELRKDAEKDRVEIAASLLSQGFTLDPAASLVPVYTHHYIVCISADPASSVVVSIMAAEAIVYAGSLRSYLQLEFLRG